MQVQTASEMRSHGISNDDPYGTLGLVVLPAHLCIRQVTSPSSLKEVEVIGPDDACCRVSMPNTTNTNSRTFTCDDSELHVCKIIVHVVLIVFSLHSLTRLLYEHHSILRPHVAAREHHERCPVS